jgi:hypothetical protein
VVCSTGASPRRGDVILKINLQLKHEKIKFIMVKCTYRHLFCYININHATNLTGQSVV